MYKTALIGPCNNIANPASTGGIIVLFENLLEHGRKESRDFIVIDTNKKNYANLLVAVFSIYFQIISAAFKVNHFSLHGTVKDYLYIGPFVVIISKLFKKTCSFRKFAGSFDSFYSQSGFISKFIIRFTLRNSSINYFETNYLVEFFKQFNQNTYWFPNVRNQILQVKNRSFRKKFVFISQIYRNKGIMELLEASNTLTDDYTVDVYGPLLDDLTESTFDSYLAEYKGKLKHEEVIDTLDKYDVLVLATYYQDEGYPGIIIEALSIGIPVIVTPLHGIQEMVDEDSAIFVKPRDSEDIKNAVMRFNVKNYKQYSENAFIAFEKFNSAAVTEKFFDSIENLKR